MRILDNQGSTLTDSSQFSRSSLSPSDPLYKLLDELPNQYSTLIGKIVQIYLKKDKELQELKAIQMNSHRLSQENTEQKESTSAPLDQSLRDQFKKLQANRNNDDAAKLVRDLPQAYQEQARRILADKDRQIEEGDRIIQASFRIDEEKEKTIDALTNITLEQRDQDLEAIKQQNEENAKKVENLENRPCTGCINAAVETIFGFICWILCCGDKEKKA